MLTANDVTEICESKIQRLLSHMRGEIVSISPTRVRHGECWIEFDATIWGLFVRWIYVPAAHRGKGELSRAMNSIVRASENSGIWIALFPREFSFTKFDPTNWAETMDSQTYDREQTGLTAEQLEAFYRRYGFEPVEWIEVSATSRALGKSALMHKPAPKLPQSPAPNYRLMRRVARGAATDREIAAFLAKSK